MQQFHFFSTAILLSVPLFLSAETINGPDFIPPFEAKKSARQDAKLVVKNFLDENKKSSEAYSLESGNKRIAIRETQLDRMSLKDDTTFTIYQNKNPFLIIKMVGHIKDGGKWFPFVENDNLNKASMSGDPKNNSILRKRPYLLPGGKKTEFSCTLKNKGDGKVELSWDFGCSKNEIQAIQEQKGEMGIMFYILSPEFRNVSMMLNGQKLLPADEALLREKKKIHTNKGVFKELVFDSENPARKIVLTTDSPFQIFMQEGFAYHRLNGSLLLNTREPTGKMVIDLGESSVSNAKAYPAVEGHDLWAQDALHRPLSPVRNLFPNPSFEQGLRYWRWLGGGAQYTPSETPRFTTDENGLFGKKALLINPVQVQSASPASFAVPTRPNTAYTISYYAKAEKPATITMAKFSVKDGGKFNWKTLGQEKREKVGTEWKRYSSSFVSDGLPFSFVLSASSTGKVWVDGIQFEQGGKATDYTEPPLEGNLAVAPHTEAGQPLNAVYEICGKSSGKVELTLMDYFKKELWKQTFEVKGGDKIVLPWDSKKLERGVFIVRAKFEGKGFAPYYDYYRFHIVKSLNGTHATKDLYSGLVSTRISRSGDFFDLMQRYGFLGSTSYGEGAIRNPLMYQLREKYKITDYLHCLISVLPPEASKLRTGNNDFMQILKLARIWRRESEKDIPKYKTYSPEVLKWVEDYSCRMTKAHPEVRVWAFDTEEETSFPCLQEQNYQEFAKLQEAYWKGVKRGNPKALLLPSGGTSGYGRLRGRRDLKGMLTATKGKIRWDAVAAHPYGAIDGITGSDDLDEVIQMLSDDMAECGYGRDTPIFLTEGQGGVTSCIWGKEPTYSYTGGNASYDLGLNEFRNAAQLARIYLITLKYWPRIPHYNTWRSDQNLYVDQTLLLAPSLNAVNTLGHLLDHPKFIDDVRPAAGMRGYVFENNKKGVAAVWCILDDVERGFAQGPVMKIKFDGELPECYDLMGRRVPLKAENGSVSFRLTPAPLFLIGNNAKKLAENLKKVEVFGAGCSVNVSFRPETNGGISAKIENLTGNVQSGRIQLGKEAFGFRVEPKKTDLVCVSKPEKPEFGRFYDWMQNYTLSLKNAPSLAASWNMKFFYIPYTKGSPDWSRVPSLPISNWYHDPKDFTASYQAAWNDENLYLRVIAEDPYFNVANPKFWESKKQQKEMLYMLDGCLEVYIDCGANGLLSRSSFDLDDYRYDFSVGNPEGKSGPGKVCRLREVFLEYAGGINMPSKEDAAKGILCDFKRISPTKYSYTIVFAQKYLAPFRLEAGSQAGFALFLHEKDREGVWRGLNTATEKGAHCDQKPYLWPRMILIK